jgi:NhaP-type Na+/H+ or K+/H+ antiporter
MLLTGIVLGPHVLDVIHRDLLTVSSDFRMIALTVILLRAGLKIRRDTINRLGRTALLMSFLPSTLEGLAVTLLAPLFFPMTYLESAMLGFIVAAVSPAVVVPSMIKFMEKRRGTGRGIPTLILASSSVDNAFVIVVFSTVLGMYAAGGGSGFALLGIPASIALGAAAGLAAGLLLHAVFTRYQPRATKKTLVVLGTGLLLIWFEQTVRSAVPFSGLVAVMAIGLLLLERAEDAAHAISNKLGKIWVPAEILLFVLVGAQVDIRIAWQAGLAGAALIAAGLLTRSVGTYVSLAGAGFDGKEKLFCAISYVPKATVQAAVGAMPAAAGVAGGDIILAVAVLSILITAPLGAIGIEKTGKRLLKKEARHQGAGPSTK